MVRNFTAENYKSLGKELTNAYKFMRCKMSLKTHILDSHLNFLKQIWVLLAMSMGNTFLKVYPKGEGMLEQVELQYVG